MIKPLRSCPWGLTVVIIVYALIHLAYIGIGFGEPDAWRNGLAAWEIGQGQGYSPNRFPGFPVVEFSFGGLARLFPPEHLWIYTNSLTLLISLIGMLVYYRILILHQITHPLLTLLGLYGIPVIFVNAASSMDHLWTMTFLLVTYWLLWKGKPALGSVFLALSIGCRISAVLFLIPFSFFLFSNPGMFTRKKAVQGSLCLLSAAVISLLGYLYINLIVYPGFYYFQQLSLPRDYLRSGYYLLQEIFGLPGTLFLLVCFLIRRKDFPPWNWESFMLAMMICLSLVLFVYRPEKAAYWIPVLPFLGIWMSRWLKGVSLYLLTVLIILNNIISFLVVQPSTEGFKIKWLNKGITCEKYHSYEQYSRDADFLIRFPYPPDTEVGTGWRYPGILYLLNLPAYKGRSQQLLNDGIVFPGNLGKEKKKNTYWVFGSGSYRTERKLLLSEKYQIIYPPSTRTGP